MSTTATTTLIFVESPDGEFHRGFPVPVFSSEMAGRAREEFARTHASLLINEDPDTIRALQFPYEGWWEQQIPQPLTSTLLSVLSVLAAAFIMAIVGILGGLILYVINHGI